MRINPGSPRLVAAAAALALILAGCASDGSAGASSTVIPSAAAEVGGGSGGATPPGGDPEFGSGEGVAITRVVDDVDYYGACGNETVTVEGTELFPLLPDEEVLVNADAYPLPEDGVDLSSLGATARVIAPGPGDDVGTMVFYDDGLVRFESDSGRVLWLTTDGRTYNWDC